MTATTAAKLDSTVSSRRNSVSSQGSSDSEVAGYVEDSRSPSPTSVTPEPTGQGITTRKGKDYRPVSSFYLKPKSKMTPAEFLCNLATVPDSLHKVKPESIDRGPVPTQSIVKENLFIIRHAFVPLVLQAISYWAFPDYKWSNGVAYTVYLLSFIAFAIAVVERMNGYCVELGTFDEKNISRDRTPDKSVNGLAKAIILYMFFRTALPFFLHYNKEVNPLFDGAIRWSFPLRMAAWMITLDYFFYVYHRSSHEVDALWFIHQHHHTTKHPTAILAILAEDYQECLEIALIPTIASLLVPMTFSELYLNMCWTIYVEMLGHSGVRSYWPHPVLWFLRYVNMDLVVEDHDLHHRFGKSGKNYGKQSRVWDQMFGTSADRIECYGF
ncbi:hypothetical protein T439DRAFT_304616 [Meredithblackwellia eburnea MCA 4105]